MALYFDNELQKPPGRQNAEFVCTDAQWHPAQNLFSITSENSTSHSDGAVHFYSHEGQPIANAFLQRSSTAQCMSWHPMKQTVAVGWSSGELNFYSNHDQSYHEQASWHKAAIVSLLWNKSGRRLVSCDVDGLVAVWSADQKGFIKHSPSYHHRLQQPISHCVLHSTNTLVPDDFAPVFCASQSGVVYRVDSSQYREAYSAGSPVLNLLFSVERQYLIIITSSMDLCQVAVNQKGDTTEILKAKLGGKGKVETSQLFRPELFVYSGEDHLIRFWDFDRDDNYTLDLSSVQALKDKAATVCSMHSDPIHDLLAVGTSSGHVVLWQHSSSSSRKPFSTATLTSDPSSNWAVVSVTALHSPVVQVKWSLSKKLLAAVTVSAVHLLSEEMLVAHYHQQMSAVQCAPNELKVECHASGSVHTLTTDLHVRAVKCCKDHVAVWGGRRMVVHNVVPDKGTVKTIGSFECDSSVFVLQEQNIFTLHGDHIQARTFQGTVKQVLSFIGDDGHPLVMSLSGHFIVAVSDTGVVKTWDISRREPKQQSVAKLSSTVLQQIGEVVSVRCNSDGSRISLITSKAGKPSAGLTIVSMANGEVLSMDFNSAVCSRLQEEEEESTALQPPEASAKEQAKLAEQVVGTLPVEHFWDTVEPRMLCVELKLDNAQQYQSDKRKKTLSEIAAHMGHKFSGLKITENRKKNIVATLFATPGEGVLLHEVVNLPNNSDRLLALSVPHLYFTKKQPSGSTDDAETLAKLGLHPSSGPHTLSLVELRDFGGLKKEDQVTLKALLSFSYHATTGNMDEAFKAIKAIKSQKVWENMARMCVLTERADVAVVCLSNMGNALAGGAAREAGKIAEPQAQLAIIAAYLNMPSEAEELYKKSKRYDLLIQFYQAMGKWNKAMEAAELHDRLHLKTTHHLHAKYSEAIGEISAAIDSYERAETYRTEVPRMLLDDPAQLEEYVMRSKDKAIRKWWGEYLESVGDLEAAVQFYESARDYFALVRVLCYMGNMKKAVAVVEETGDKAAAFHLARQLENAEETKKAVWFYSQAQCYSSAIRLAKESGLDSELMNMALLSTSRDMLDAAKYFEGNQDTVDRAILLYHKGGEISHALELCFQYEQFDTLQRLVGELSEASSPEMVSKCAQFFADHGQFPRAVDLLVKAKKFSEALDLCMTQNITVTEDMADRMTVGTVDTNNPQALEERNRLLEHIAEVCAYQGNCHLAARKFTQAGNRIKGMKALLKSGDTERIAVYAQVSRQKDIYIMAANYLQTLDWRGSPEIMKSVITFYTKGRALESLAGFYDSCAQIEIDEYQNYTKALGALNEAVKCLSKVKTKTKGLEDKITFFQDRLNLVDRFATARRMYQESEDESVKGCMSLLEEPSLDTAVRAGDVFGLLIEHYHHKGNYQQAYSLMEEMRKRLPGVNIAFYVDMATIENVHRTLGIPLGSGEGGVAGGGSEPEEESVGEVEDED